jgi:7-cyano-7-deazaguanine synthase
LNLDFDEVYKRTNTSYKPIFISNNAYPGSDDFGGKWYSDYKSAASVERIEAFLKLGRIDPVQYADESGPVTWQVVSGHVRKLLESHSV